MAAIGSFLGIAAGSRAAVSRPIEDHVYAGQGQLKPIRIWYYDSGNQESMDAVRKAMKDLPDRLNILVARTRNAL